MSKFLKQAFLFHLLHWNPPCGEMSCILLTVTARMSLQCEVQYSQGFKDWSFIVNFNSFCTTFSYVFCSGPAIYVWCTIIFFNLGASFIHICVISCRAIILFDIIVKWHWRLFCYLWSQFFMVVNTRNTNLITHLEWVPDFLICLFNYDDMARYIAQLAVPVLPF